MKDIGNYRGVRFIVDDALPGSQGYLVSFKLCPTCGGAKAIRTGWDEVVERQCPECDGIGAVLVDYVKIKARGD